MSQVVQNNALLLRLKSSPFDQVAKEYWAQLEQSRNQWQAQVVGSRTPYGGSNISARDTNGCETEFATPLHQEIALLRERITTLEIENARLSRELVAARAPQPSSDEPLPAAECDRIWNWLCMAAQT